MLSRTNFVNSFDTASSAGAIPSPIGSLPGTLGHKVFWFQPLGGTTLGTNLGGTVTGAGTISTAITPGSASYPRFRRALSTSAAAINSASGIFQSYARYARSSTGGFEAQFIFGVEGVQTAGHGAFCGFSPNVAAIASADITTQVNCIGVGFTAADAAGAVWSIVSNDNTGAATMTPITGMTRSSTTGYRMTISMLPGDAANATIAVWDAVSGAQILAPTVISSNLPVTGTALSPGIHAYTGAATAAIITSMADIYVSTYY